MEMYSEINTVSTPANTISLLKPIDQGIISAFKSYYLRNILHKATTTIDSDLSDGSGQDRLKIWEGLAI